MPTKEWLEKYETVKENLFCDLLEENFKANPKSLHTAPSP